MSLYPFPITLITPVGGAGGAVPTGNQAASNPLGYSSASLADPLELGSAYAPTGAISLFSGGVAWNTPTANRLHACGPAFVAPASGTVELQAYCQGGTNAQKFRLALYQDNGSATVTQVGRSGETDSYTAGSRPGTLIGITGETTVAAGTVAAPEAYRGTGETFNVVAGTIYHVALWLENIASGAQFVLLSNGVNCNYYRTDSGVANYSSAGSPPNPFPGASPTTDTQRQSYVIRAVYTDPAPGTIVTVTATPRSSERCIDVAWTAASNATGYRIERSTNAGGSWDRLARLVGLAYPDRDLATGTTYLYRVYPLRDAEDNTPTVSNSATVSGVRVAYAAVSPSITSSSSGVWNPLSGLSGGNQPVTGVTDHEEYDRTGFEWNKFQTTSNPATFTWTASDNFLSGLAAQRRGWWRFRCQVNDEGNQLPPFMTASTDYYNIDEFGDYWPNWNNAQVLTWLKAWIDAAGARYNNDSRLTVIDMGYYAQYGEWAGRQGADPATPQTKRDLIDWITTAFSNKLVVMSAMDTSTQDEEDVFWHALGKPNVVGCRQDALGRLTTSYMYQQIYGGDRSLRTQNLMRSRSFYRACEYFDNYTDAATSSWILIEADSTALRLGVTGGANNEFVDGLGAANRARAVTGYRVGAYRFTIPYATFPSPINRANDNVATVVIENVGLGPLIEDRALYLQFRQAGSVVSEQEIDVDLTMVLPGERALTLLVEIEAANVPAAGTYDITIEGPSFASGRVPALNFAIDSTRQGGGYVLFEDVTVEA